MLDDKCSTNEEKNEDTYLELCMYPISAYLLFHSSIWYFASQLIYLYNVLTLLMNLVLMMSFCHSKSVLFLSLSVNLPNGKIIWECERCSTIPPFKRLQYDKHEDWSIWRVFLFEEWGTTEYVFVCNNYILFGCSKFVTLLHRTDWFLTLLTVRIIDKYE